MFQGSGKKWINSLLGDVCDTTVFTHGTKGVQMSDKCLRITQSENHLSEINQI